MAVSIQLNDHFRLNAEKIGNERTEGNLSPKLQPFQFAISELHPETSLGGSFAVSSQNSRELSFSF